MSNSRKRFPFIKIIILLLIAGVFTLVVLSISRKTAPPEKEYPAPVITIQPGRGRLETIIHINGWIQADEIVTISPRISGVVESISVQMGDSVKEGELILQIDNSPYELSFLQARAAYLSAESTFSRIESLYDRQASTRQDYDVARAGYEAAKSQFELAQLNLEYTRILSPISGSVLETHINRGSMAGPGTPLVTVGDLDTLMVEVHVPEEHYSFFLQGESTMEAFMTVSALGDQNIPLEIEAISSHINMNTRSFLVKCRISEETRGLRPGMHVKVGFITGFQDDVLYLPFKVTSEGNRLWFVNSNGAADYTIFIPDFYSQDYFSIPEEYADYDFILEGQHFISPGREVTVIEERTVPVFGSVR
ncbi:MAG: efflux RND transporter periplasmic adaptor subunit [Spirochaetales bacterium]|nr:efflux RND transporter periplasmic adaptor subunit [Spirochaetales bacterium]